MESGPWWILTYPYSALLRVTLTPRFRMLSKPVDRGCEVRYAAAFTL